MPAVPLAVQALAVYGLRPAWQWRMRGIPGPPLTWMVGNALDLQRHGWHGLSAKLSAKYGGVFKARPTCAGRRPP